MPPQQQRSSFNHKLSARELMINSLLRLPTCSRPLCALIYVQCRAPLECMGSGSAVSDVSKRPTLSSHSVLIIISYIKIYLIACRRCGPFSHSNHSSWLVVVVGFRHAIMQIYTAPLAITLAIYTPVACRQRRRHM